MLNEFNLSVHYCRSASGSLLTYIVTVRI